MMLKSAVVEVALRRDAPAEASWNEISRGRRDPSDGDVGRTGWKEMRE
jgi:hypothetical protein